MEKPAPAARVAVGEADQVVVRTRDVVAVEDLGAVAHRLLEGLEHLPAERLEIDDRVADAVLADRAWIHQRDVLRDHAAVLERLDAPQAGRRGEVDACGEFLVGDAAGLLKLGQDGPVDRIQLHADGIASHRILKIV